MNGASGMPPRVLVVDDDWDIRDSLQHFFSERGFQADVAADAESARALLEATPPDVVLLDIMLPGEDGLSLSRYLYSRTNIPVLLLTARTGDEDRLLGFDTGAVDYVCKPFNPNELLARVRVALRSQGYNKQSKSRFSAVASYRFDRWTVDVERRQVVRADGLVVSLSAREFQVLKVLVTHPRKVLARDHILALVGKDDGSVFDRSVDSQISRLRRKLEHDPRQPQLITTVWGGGYLLDAAVEKE